MFSTQYVKQINALENTDIKLMHCMAMSLIYNSAIMLRVKILEIRLKYIDIKYSQTSEPKQSKWRVVQIKLRVTSASEGRASEINGNFRSIWSGKIKENYVMTHAMI